MLEVPRSTFFDLTVLPFLFLPFKWSIYRLLLLCPREESKCWKEEGMGKLDLPAVVTYSGQPFLPTPQYLSLTQQSKSWSSKPATIQESMWGAALNLLLGHQIKLILKLKLWCRRRLPGSTRQGPICPSSQFEIPMGGNGFLRQSLWNDTSKTKMTNPFWVALGGRIKTLAKCPFSAEGQSWQLLAALCMQAEPSVSWNCFGTERTDEKWRQTWAQSISWCTQLKVGWRRNFRSKAVSGFLC